ncbi:hypothetical protein Tco_1435729 [Tanacetum coccineum]
MKLNDEPPTWIMKAIGRILEEGMVPEQNSKVVFDAAKVEKALSNVEMKNRVSIPVMAWVLQLKQDKLAKKGSGKGFRILRLIMFKM